MTQLQTSQVEPLIQESLEYHVPDGSGYLHRIYTKNPGPAVFLVHGSLENGRIFYSEKGKGLAPFLAQIGFDTFTMDWRGKGRSTPPIQRGHDYGQTECITQDLAACLGLIRKIKNPGPIFLIGHSWGGVLVSSFLVRFPDQARDIEGIVYLGAKRRILVWNLKRLVGIEFLWRGMGNILCTVFGFFNARLIRLGVENDTRRFHSQITQWVKNNPWIDPEDGFNYARAARQHPLPPILYLTGEGDRFLGNPKDVQRLIDESGQHPFEFRVIGRKTGFTLDYGHVDLLTHPKAKEEVYPMVAEWFKRHDPSHSQ